MAYRGNDFILQIAWPTIGSSFVTIGGGRASSLSIDGGPKTTTDFIGQLAELVIPNTQVLSCSISASGIFTDSNGEQKVQALKLSGEIWNFRLLFENNKALVGGFYVTGLQISGDMGQAQPYSFSLVGHNIKGSNIT